MAANGTYAGAGGRPDILHPEFPEKKEKSIASVYRAGRGGGGVLVKRPKPGQDLRVDMPSIGPETLRGAARAGLAGVAIAAGAVLVLDRAATLAAAEEAGLFLLAQ